MGTRLTWQKVENGGAEVPKFVVQGDITEFADFASLQRELSPDTELDLNGIKQVNSTGVREWMKFMTAVTAAGQRLVLSRCSVSFVNQLNMIRRFAGDARIASIVLPYACDACETASERVLELAPGVDVLRLAEEPWKCPTCGDNAVFDDVPHVYFSFLNT